MRAAVGASVDRLVRQMMTDSLLLAAAGGVLGVAARHCLGAAGGQAGAHALPIAEVPPIDLRMLAGRGADHLVTGLAFGVLPALRVCRKADASR